MNYCLGVEELNEVVGDLSYWSRGDITNAYAPIFKDSKYFKSSVADSAKAIFAARKYKADVAKMSMLLKNQIIRQAGINKVA